MTTPPTLPGKISRRKRRLIRIAIALATGGVLGQLCPLLPHEAQLICHLAAKIVSLVAGGT